MFLEKLRPAAILSLSIPATLCVTAVLISGAPPTTAIKIDSVADKYAMQDFEFDVNPESGRAGIRLEYSYPPARVGDSEETGPTKIVTVSGLTYDPATHTVVYADGAERTICATAAYHKMVLWNRAYMKSTGACTVSARVTLHVRDDGWSHDRFSTLDTYLEVRHQ